MTRAPKSNKDRAAGAGRSSKLLGVMLLALSVTLGGAVLTGVSTTSSVTQRGDGGQDECFVSFGGERVLFSAYQPDSLTHNDRRLCRKLPELDGRSILVFDLVNPDLRNIPISVSIVPADMAQTQDLVVLKENAVAYRPPDIAPSGSIMVEYDFAQNPAGKYRAVLSAASSPKKMGDFVFEVGAKTLNPFFQVTALIGALALLIGAIFLIARKSKYTG